ncbi:TPA: host cell division inhibitor Icd-like protein [Escherichia coli]|nr:host cell division inhibitor Icd-like protein [Escherichia coli]HCO5399698.1 host cell division inhibitor Icd-like protein [Escherichia coli]HCO7798819.1 host cell division inhibitor Icd-like protein [Escherichia coli]
MTVTKRESAPLPERLCERITYSTAMFAMWVNFSDKFVQCEGADHRYYSTPEMQNILLQNAVGHAVRKAKNFAGGATDTIFSGRPALINYSCSLVLRRWSSSRATVTSCPISSAALTPIFSTCASASSEETRGFSPLPSAWRRAISPRMAVTMNPALLSPSSFTDSIPSITSWGTLIVVICDFAFLYTDIVNHQLVMCISLYTKVRYKNTCNVYHHNIMYISHCDGYVSHNDRFIKTTKPGSALTLTGLLTTNDSKSIEVAMRNHTTHPQGRDSHNLNKYIWRFIALSTAQPRVIHIEATSEQEARQQSPDGCVMVFAARIRQEVHHD